MVAILKKEIKENLPWAALGLLVVSLAFYAGLGEGGPGFLSLFGSGRGYYPSGLPLLSHSLLPYTTAVYAIFGAALGMLQTIPESVRGTYPFLVHRPVRRGRLLLGKALAGAAMYAVAGGVPLLLAVIWVAVPGHYAAPFRVAMAGPVFADFLCGLVFYLAGILTGVRRAKWYGTRLAGFGVALIVMFLAHSVSKFLAAVAVEIAGAAVLLWAAYAAFLRREF
jgi:ABC-type transport system involved in multi-copper enzyme maturation permease subunit